MSASLNFDCFQVVHSERESSNNFALSSNNQNNESQASTIQNNQSMIMESGVLAEGIRLDIVAFSQQTMGLNLRDETLQRNEPKDSRRNKIFAFFFVVLGLTTQFDYRFHLGTIA